jgi:glycosyltransferase involved in cell wall biosynthesis
MEGPKVLHLIDSGGLYGAEKVLLALLEELKHSPFSCILGCIQESPDAPPEIAVRARQAGIPTVPFPMKRGFNLRGIRKITAFVRENGVNIVHNHGYKPNLFMAAVPREFKTLSTAHLRARHTALKGRLYEWLDARALRRMDRVAAVSGAVAEDLARAGVPRDKIKLVRNGIPAILPSARNPSGIRERFGIPAGGFVIGAVGRLAKQKGHEYLLKAMASLPPGIRESHLVIAGEGPLRDSLERQIEELGLRRRVRLAGYIREMDEFLSMIDLYVLPSLFEGLPMSLLEAMQAGKPVVAAAVDGVPEVIASGEEGLLVPPGDIPSLAEAIGSLIRDSRKRERMALAGKKAVADRFSSRGMAEQYAVLYRELMESGRP